MSGMSCRDNFINLAIIFSNWKGREEEKDMPGICHFHINHLFFLSRFA